MSKKKKEEFYTLRVTEEVTYMMKLPKAEAKKIIKNAGGEQSAFDALLDEYWAENGHPVDHFTEVTERECWLEDPAGESVEV